VTSTATTAELSGRFADRSRAEPSHDGQDYALRTLPVVLWLTLLGCIASAILALANHDGETAAGVLAAATLIGVAIALTRRRRVRLASAAFIGDFLLLAVYLQWTGHGLRDVAVLLYPLILIFGGLLLDGRAFSVLFALCLGSLALIARERPLGGDAMPVADVASTQLLYITIILTVTTAVVWLLASALRRSLREARTSERAQRASEASFTKAFHSSPVIMAITSLDDARVLDVNDAFSAATGFAREDVIGSPTIEVPVFVDVQEVLAIRAAMLARGTVRGVPLRLRSRAGGTLWTLVSGESIELDGRNCALFAVTDVSEREALLRELEAKNAELERFSYTVSHDLKSPLITVQSFIGFLEQDAASGNLDRLREDVGRIRGASEKMLRMLDELLELSRIGRVASALSEVRFSELVEDALGLVRGRLDQAGVVVEVGPDLPVVRGDRGRLLLVLQNLLDNAVKFMGESREPRIEIGCRREGGRAVFYVRDNGIGIEPRHHDKVFGLFEKLDPGSGGTGLGLALARRVVETHQGRIWVESAGEGRGATFCFTLGERDAGSGLAPSAATADPAGPEPLEVRRSAG